MRTGVQCRSRSAASGAAVTAEPCRMPNRQWTLAPQEVRSPVERPIRPDRQRVPQWGHVRGVVRVRCSVLGS